MSCDNCVKLTERVAELEKLLKSKPSGFYLPVCNCLDCDPVNGVFNELPDLDDDDEMF